MAEAAFYHLTARSLEEALPQLLARTLERGWRAVVEAGDADRLRALDAHLWTFSDAAFLPHGSALGADGGPDPHPDRQPVWLTLDAADRPNGATVRFFVAGAFPAPGFDAGPYERIAILFDGRDGAEVSRARAAWAALRGTAALAYWKQADTGAWQRAAEG